MNETLCAACLSQHSQSLAQLLIQLQLLVDPLSSLEGVMLVGSVLLALFSLQWRWPICHCFSDIDIVSLSHLALFPFFQNFDAL